MKPQDPRLRHLPTPADEPPSPADAAYRSLTRGLREACDRPVPEQEVQAFVRAARIRRQERAPSARRPWLFALIPVGGLAAAGIVSLLALFGGGRDEPERPGSPQPATTAASQLQLTAAQDVQVSPPLPTAASPIPAATTFRSGARGAAVLRDAATATVSIEAQTVVHVASWDPHTAVLEVAQGTVRAVVRHRAADQRFEVRTPYAVVRVVGTDFTVRHLPGEASLVEGREGRVTVETRDGRSLGTVGAGQSLRIEPPRVAPEADAQAAAATSPRDPARPGKAVANGLPAPPGAVARAERGSPPSVAPTRVPPPSSMPPRHLTPPEPAPWPSPGAAMQPPAAPPAPAGPIRAAPPSLPIASSSGPADSPAPAPWPTPPPQVATAEAPAAASAVTLPPLARRPLVTPPPPPPPARPWSEAETLQQARLLIATGKDEDAIALLLAYPSRSWPLEQLLGDALRLAGRGVDARAAYERALAAAGTPPPERLLLDLAELLHSEDGGGSAATVAIWQRYLSAFPAGRAAARARWALADHLLTTGQGRAARSQLTHLLAAHPEAPEAALALVHLGRLLLAARDWNDAAHLFAAHVAGHDPVRVEVALIGLARARIGQGRLDEARALLARYRERFPAGRRLEEAAHLERALTTVR